MSAPVLKQLLEQGQIWLGRGESMASPKQAFARFGISSIDRLQALGFGAIHEWSLENRFECKSKNIWYPPSFICTAVLGTTLRSFDIFQQKSLVGWIGKRVWPTPFLLQRTLRTDKWSWNSQGLFLDPPNKEERLWSTLQLLRSQAVFAVFADGSGFNFIATRRLQLAAQKNNSLCFLFRPPWEIGRTSSAYTKWKISTLADWKQGADNDERWHIELISGKGILTPLNWNLEWQEGEQGGLHLVEEPRGERRAELIARQA